VSTAVGLIQRDQDALVPGNGLIASHFEKYRGKWNADCQKGVQSLAEILMSFLTSGVLTSNPQKSSLSDIAMLRQLTAHLGGVESRSKRR
jgi:hypothetical protein